MKAYVNMSDYSVEERNKRALDDLVWRVMENEKGRPFDLVDFLADEPLAEVVAQLLRNPSDHPRLHSFVESRLRARLEDSDAVSERAAELAKEE